MGVLCLSPALRSLNLPPLPEVKPRTVAVANEHGATDVRYNPNAPGVIPAPRSTFCQRVSLSPRTNQRAATLSPATVPLSVIPLPKILRQQIKSFRASLSTNHSPPFLPPLRYGG